MISFVLAENKLRVLCEHITSYMMTHPIILLRGNLASGKTTFTKSLVSYMGIKQEVTSPTFTTMNVYDNRFFHYDIYQEGLKGLVTKGLMENFEQVGVHVVEWGDEELEKILKEYGFNYLVIDIEKDGEQRKYEVEVCTN